MRRETIALLVGGAPAWVRAKYGAAGVMPDVVADFANDRYWDRRFGQISVTSMFAISRASESHADDFAGNWAQFASGSITRSNRGLHVWEGSTNNIRNNSMQGVAAGSPGTLPVNWSETLTGGVSRTVVAAGTVNGIDYIDIRFFGNTTNTTDLQIFPDGATQIAAANGQTWTQSWFVQLIAGDLDNITNVTYRNREIDSGGGVLANNGTGDFRTSISSSSLLRFSGTSVFGNASTAFASPVLCFTPATNPVMIDFTVRLGWPQFEQKAFATPPMRTTGSTFARATDAVSLRNNCTYGQAWTLFSAGAPRTPTTNSVSQALIEPSDGTTVNRSPIFRNGSSGQDRALMLVGGATQLTLVAAAWIHDVAGKTAAAFSSGDSAISFSGGAAITSLSTYTPFAPTVTGIGSRSGGSLAWNGLITDVAIWPTTRLPNAAMQAITA